MIDEILFFGDIPNEYRCLSMEYECLVDYNDHYFRSVLHLYLYLRFKSNAQIRKKLLNLTNQSEILIYGKELIEKEQLSPEYDLSDDMINMTLAVEAMVNQNEKIKILLLESKKKNLLYVVGHSIIEPLLWTYKILDENENLNIEDIEEKEDKNTGQNLYGNILKMIRLSSRNKSRF